MTIMYDNEALYDILKLVGLCSRPMGPWDLLKHFVEKFSVMVAKDNHLPSHIVIK